MTYSHGEIFCILVVALEIKWKAPKAHTLLELVYVRWGRIAHMVSHFLYLQASHAILVIIE